MPDRPAPGSIEDRDCWHRHLYGDVPCRCRSAYKSIGRLDGITMGKGWVRMDTHPDCPHHGTKAQAEWRRKYGRKAKRG